MQSDLAAYPVARGLLILFVLLLHQLWRGGKPSPAAPKPPKLKREPKPFAGLTRKPDCELCEQQGRFQPQAPGAPPPRMIVARGRRRHVDTTGHFCPHAACAYHVCCAKTESSTPKGGDFLLWRRAEHAAGSGATWPGCGCGGKGTRSRPEVPRISRVSGRLSPCPCGVRGRVSMETKNLQPVPGISEEAC